MFFSKIGVWQINWKMGRNRNAKLTGQWSGSKKRWRRKIFCFWTNSKICQSCKKLPCAFYTGFFPSFFWVFQIFFKVGGAFHERFVKRTKKMYGPNPKTYRVGPIYRNFSLRQAVLSHHMCWADPHLKDLPTPYNCGSRCDFLRHFFFFICFCSARIVHSLLVKLRTIYCVCKSKFTPRVRTFYLCL